MEGTDFLDRMLGLVIGLMASVIILNIVGPMPNMIEAGNMVVPETPPWPFLNFEDMPAGYIPENEWGIFYVILVLFSAIYSVAGTIAISRIENDKIEHYIWKIWLGLFILACISHGVAIWFASDDLATMIGATIMLAARNLLMNAGLIILTFVATFAFVPKLLIKLGFETKGKETD